MAVKTKPKPTRTKPNRRKPAKSKPVERAQSQPKSSNRNHGKKASKSKKGFLLFSLEPWKIIAGLIVIGVLGIFYLRHVFATQVLLGQVEQLEQQYKQINRKHDYYKLKYDRMIGPKEIYDKAKAAGFVDGGPAQKVIEVKPVE